MKAESRSSSGRLPGNAWRVLKVLLVLGLVGIGVLILMMVVSPFAYFLERVNPDEMGVRISGGEIVDIVGPGVYSDVGLFVRMDKYSTQSYQFTVTDPEVITRDNQRIGVTVSGSVFRPGIAADRELIKRLWTNYRNVFVSDEALSRVIENFTMQAMKVCVGDRPFRDSIIGSERDTLRKCIDDELSKLATNFGLDVDNVTVPNVALSPEVQSLLDAITKSRLETEKAEQDKLKAEAEGRAQQAEQEAAVRVELSKQQEESRQQTTLAALNQQKLVAQQAVILAEKENDLLAAQKDLQINKALADAAQEKARQDLAREYVLASLYSSNSAYLQYQMASINASTLKNTDKLIFTTQGVYPQLVLGSNISAVLPVSGTQLTPGLLATPTPGP